ncbi:MAG: response regulator [Proteobacteria bacterium]|nr:response regulator [Pseudomonadota bacterium]
MRFLIVDDDHTNRRLLTILLKDYCDCELAVNGLQAVELVHKSIEEKNCYDVIFLDILMPEMDGHEALQEIRKLESASGLTHEDKVKIIIVTALGDSRNVLSAFSEGCEYYLVKPIQQKKLYGLLSELGFQKGTAN